MLQGQLLISSDHLHCPGEADWLSFWRLNTLSIILVDIFHRFFVFVYSLYSHEYLFSDDVLKFIETLKLYVTFKEQWATSDHYK